MAPGSFTVNLRYGRGCLPISFTVREPGGIRGGLVDDRGAPVEGELGIGERTGAVKPGLEADLSVLDRYPIADLRAVENPVVVVNDGRIAVNKIGR